MGKFSIRRHKRELSDSSTIVTVEPSMSPSQRSLYGSIISSRPRNRLQKTHPPPSPDENRDGPDATDKRPQRKLLKRLRQPLHRRTGSSPEATISITPPEQKSHSTSLPTSPDRPLGVGGRRYASRNWSDNDIRPPRTRFLYASPRGSVGSSADILLTPIRGSTALSDEDFVFLPNRDEIIQTQNELAETPGSPVQNVLNAPNSEMRPHPVLLEPIVIEPTYTSQPELIPLEFKPLPAPPILEPLSHPAPEPEPGPEPEDPSTPVARSFISETQTITNAVVEVNPKVHRESLVVLLAPGSKGSTRELPGDRGIEPTSPITPQTPLQQSAPISVPTKSPSPPTKLLTVVTEIPSQQNIIPFPSNLESARTPTRDQRPYSIAITEAASTEPHHGAGVTWVISAYQTACGIMLLAIDCYRWLVRKGFRDDFRSCMSCWFLKELVIGFVLPLCVTPLALWLLFKTMHDHQYGLESIHF
ncbi:hypothetical protein RSOLAG1IB_00240 [Rhizoctonia solani AG-1 IB]|uniref:Uncharacterized protein n=1 Tax=Thanatephorus cucumeris (strain AG1-IB / isolate 7/3/14) TaxID=1108050 RepID=A0A0B7F2I3_THACB|nr:hypothetical protein RSOLAG1IB_00240 [Rhizoctonia solani AG-1 IB]